MTNPRKLEGATSTELLARYLHAIEPHLPSANRDDILAELGDAIHSHFDESEAELGRPLTLDEQSAVIKQFGPPIVAASRYWSQQQLIGPLLLPYYWYVVKIALSCLVAVDVVAVFAIPAITSGSALVAFGRFWAFGVIGAAATIGIVTAVFGIIERFGGEGRAASGWDPRKLPPLGDEPVSPVQSASEFAMNAIFAILLVSVIGVPRLAGDTLVLLGGNAGFGLAPVFRWGELTVLLLVLAQGVVALATLLRPQLTRLRALTIAAANAIAGVAAFAIASQRPLVVATPNPRHLPYAQALAVANDAVFAALLAVGAFAFVAGFFYLRKFIRIGSARQTQALNALA